MTSPCKEGMQACLRYNSQEIKFEDYPSDSSRQGCVDQDYYYPDDPQCPCYACTNDGMDTKSAYSDDESSATVEFSVRSFWRLAKTQNDIESPTEGHCRGFHYKLLLHPRGTAGTDSESSHLSVFVEAVVQDWYPEYWVFPNVRFELTVVNFKDPKQSVTSWAHWSFSSDATSRGWQKMISHSKLTKAAGFIDDEGTVLVRGKAEPPYPLLWSKAAFYHPQMMWEYIPNRAQREVSTEIQFERQASHKYNRAKSPSGFVLDCYPLCTFEKHSSSCRSVNLNLPKGDFPSPNDRDFCTCREIPSSSGNGEPNVKANPVRNDSQHGDPELIPSDCKVACAGHISTQTMVNLPEDKAGISVCDDIADKEGYSEPFGQKFRKNTVSSSTLLRFLDSVIPSIQPTLDADLVAIMTHILYHIREFRKRILMWNYQQGNEDDGEYEVGHGSNRGNSIIVALQKTFAYMQLYPLAATCKAYRLAGVESHQLSKYYVYELLPKLPSGRRCLLDYGYHTSYKNCAQSRNLYERYEGNPENKSFVLPHRGQGLSPTDKFCGNPFQVSIESSGDFDGGTGEQFQGPECCIFDGGRFEWELNSDTNDLEGIVGDARSVDQCKKEEDQIANDFTATNFVENGLSSFRLVPGTLSYSIGDRPDIFDKILPPPPNLKLLLKAMHMTDLQVLEIQDKLVNIHTELFTMLLHDLASAKRQLKHKRLFSTKGDRNSDSAADVNKDGNVPWFLRDQTDLEITCKSLFSGSGENEGLFHSASVNDISTAYIRCKHAHSLQKALKTTAKTMVKYPEVLFFYLYPAKNAKKGELFDVPLRLDCTNLCEGNNTASLSTNYEIQSLHHDNESVTPIAGSNSCECAMAHRHLNYGEYSEDHDDLTQDEDDEDDEEEDSGVNFPDYAVNGTNKGKDMVPVKWYSLYALILCEGDVRAEGSCNGGNNFHSLLLRPEEDGPWYRICEGRVEKLSTKMEFTEWKCHRDFFCAAAVYVAEDYIDMLQVGEVDLSGNLKNWNPKLYYETLEQLGISEQDILDPSIVSLTEQYYASFTNNPFAQKKRGSDVSVDKEEGGYDDSVSCSVDRSCVQDLKVANTLICDTDTGVGTNVDNLDTVERVCPLERIIDSDLKVPLYSVDKELESLVYKRKVGQRHPRLVSCCETHGYTPSVLDAMNERELRCKMIRIAPSCEISQRINRVETIKPFISWLFNASKENTALLNGIKPPADGKLLVKFLQQRERLFEEEFRHLISEIFFKEVGKRIALNSIYRWDRTQFCGCKCSFCAKGCSALLLTENGRFPGEELKTYLSEPSTILFRNIQILRCHLEYFCKDCRNLSLQTKDQRLSDIHEFKTTSERSALFLIECIWDACVRYTHDCRTILYLKALSDNPSNTGGSFSSSQTSALMQQGGINAKKAGTLHPPMEPCDLFVFDGTLSQSIDMLEEEMADYFDTKYDLSVQDELKIMHYLSKKYKLPTVSKMRKFLRENNVLVYGLIRPHELARCYLEKLHRDCDIKQELKCLGIEILWNDSAFTQRASLDALSQEERLQYGVECSLVDTNQTIGYHLCKVYEELITRMLLHMQDAEKDLDPKLYDYVYTHGDIAKVVGAIQLECAKTVKNKGINLNTGGRDESCTCGSSLASCNVQMQRPTPDVPDFGIQLGNLSWDVTDLGSVYSEQAGLQNDCSNLSGDRSDLGFASNNQKRKAKSRKQNMERSTCIIPPLDVKLRDIQINQQLAFSAEPELFPDTAELMRFSCMGQNISGLNPYGRVRKWINNFHVLYNQPYSHDFSIAMKYASMLKLENANSKAIATPLLTSCKQNEVYAMRIKCAIEIGIITTHDLFGCEGFSSEERINPTKRLLVYHELIDETMGKTIPIRVEHLYWFLRRLLHRQIPADFDRTFIQPPKGKKTKTTSRCICGGTCPNGEFECPTNLRWRPMPRDTFMLYALRPDPNPIRKGRRRFVFMQPEVELAQYMDACRLPAPTKNPDIVILMVGAPASLYNTPSAPFPLSDDSEYPLLLFKWMCPESVDLLFLGAVVCDAKKQLQLYIFEWLLPLVRELGYLRKLGPNEKEDIDRYQILEECSIRTVQNVRRWSCAIRKINKRTGDIIIAQIKRTVDSPASLRFKEAVAFMHTVRELEALELLPPAGNLDEGFEGSMGSQIMNADLLEKPAEDLAQKLAKKKKKKAPKTAIPSNKKSTFSKSVYPLAEDGTEDDRVTEYILKDEAKVVTGVSPVKLKLDREYDDAYKSIKFTDINEEASMEITNGDKIYEDRVSIYNMIEECLEYITSEDGTIKREAAKGDGFLNESADEFVLKLDALGFFSGHSDFKSLVYSYIQQIMADELNLFAGSIEREVPDNVIMVIKRSRARACVDLLLSLMRFISDKSSSIQRIESIIDVIYEKDPFVTAGICSYLLCALGNLTVLEFLKSDVGATFINKVFQRLIDQSTKNSHVLFLTKGVPENALGILRSVLSCLHIYSEANVLSELFEEHSHVLFLVKIVHDKLNRYIEAYQGGVLSLSSLGFRQDAFDRFISVCGKDDNAKSNDVFDAFKSTLSPFSCDEHLEPFERLALQELRIWWHHRDIALSSIKVAFAKISQKNNGMNFKIVIDLEKLNVEERVRQLSQWDTASGRAIPISINELQYLKQCCNRFCGDLGLEVNDTDVHVFKKQHFEYREVDCKEEALELLFETFRNLEEANFSKNLKRSVANVPIDAKHMLYRSSSLHEMKLWSSQTALIVMSLKRSSQYEKISTSVIEDIIERSFSFKIQCIPPPPKIPPPHPQFTL